MEKEDAFWPKQATWILELNGWPSSNVQSPLEGLRWLWRLVPTNKHAWWWGASFWCWQNLEPLLSFSWCSMVQNALGGACSEILLYIFGLFEKFTIDSDTNAPGTMECFFKILAWSFRAMWEGQWPSHDWRGVAFLPGTKEWIFGPTWATFLDCFVCNKYIYIYVLTLPIQTKSKA